MGEDEGSYCPTAPPPVPAPLCDLDHFLCNDGQCIPNTNVCNGRWDCTNGDDEAAFCEPMPTQEPPSKFRDKTLNIELIA